MTPLSREALRLADVAVAHRPAMRELPEDDRRAVADLASSIALQVADALVDAARAEPALAQALSSIYGPELRR
jgi:hypothetical protein